MYEIYCQDIPGHQNFTYAYQVLEHVWQNLRVLIE